MPRFAAHAKRYEPTLRDGKITFRHPWVLDRKRKRGIPIMIRVARMTPKDQGEYFERVQALINVAPRYRDRVPRGTPEKLIETYFKPMEEEEKSVRFKVGFKDPKAVLEKGGPFDIEGIPAKPEDLRALKQLTEGSFEFSKELFKKLHYLESRVQELEDEKASLQAQLDRVIHSTGERSKAEKETAIKECLQHFKKTFRVRQGASKQQRDDVLHRIEVVIKPLLDRKYGKVKESDLVDCIEASKPATENERSKRVQAVKRFFRHLCKREEANGLGFINNPAAELKAKSVKTIQRQRQSQGLVKFLDPRVLLASDRLDDYWKQLVAVMGFAGLRNAECANLEWELIDFKDRLIRVRPSSRYPELKSVISARDVRPFPDLWPWLKARRKAVPKDFSLVFGRPTKPNSDWFSMKKDRPKATKLSDALRKMLEPLSEEAEPNLRLRRFWDTKMREHGHGDLILPMGGHQEAVAANHYNIWEKAVATAHITHLGSRG